MTHFHRALISATAISLALAAPLAAQDAATAEAPAADAPTTEAPATDAPAAEVPATAAPASPAVPVVTKPGDDRVMPAAGSYVFDPAHSQIVFSYDHMGFSTSHGFVNGVEGRIELDPANLAAATVEASFPLSALHTIDAALDEHLRSADFFNLTDEDPVITFKSTSVQLDDDNEALVTGDLTLNGVTKPVTLEVEFEGAGLDPMTQIPTIGFTAEADLKRSDFNLDAFAPAVSDEVELEISVEAKKDG